MRRANASGDSFFGALVGDGRPPLFAFAGALTFAGGFAMFMAATRELLPQDVHYLGMTAADVCRIDQCRLLDFMVHDRASWGGAMFGIGVLYAWLVAFPLARREEWAWWALVVSGAVGFSGFLSYLGYGYLDTWHGIGTLLLLPVFVVGIVKARGMYERGPRVASLFRPGESLDLGSRRGIGRAILVLGSGATAAGGLMILRIGVTDIFVPEDLRFMRVPTHFLRGVSDRLVPLMAHDRAGFGGAVVTLGLTALLCVWCARFSRSLWQAMLLSGVVALAAAIGVHYVVGYTSYWHLAPALAAATSLVLGLGLTATDPSPRAS